MGEYAELAQALELPEKGPQHNRRWPWKEVRQALSKLPCQECNGIGILIGCEACQGTGEVERPLTRRQILRFWLRWRLWGWR